MRDELVRAITADGLDKSTPSFLLPQPPWAALCWEPPCWATC